MNINNILSKAYQFTPLNINEAIHIYKYAELSELIFYANEIRKKLHQNNTVTYIIDRNINITNACISRCKFCNFHKKPKDKNVYITSFDEYITKINELYKLGGNQILLQGGLHPALGLNFYTELFRKLKSYFPDIKLHALGPPEIAHISNIERLTHKEVLTQLINAGLDSLPGAGAEILNNKIRKIISPGKCDADTWLNIMHEAHKLDLITSATMMFGHMESIENRIEHIIKIRDLQSAKPRSSTGFISFTPWPFQDYDTILSKKYKIYNKTSAEQYIRLIATSRIILTNIKNIQASWLTVGTQTGQVALNSGANDFGSIMIEENVVSVAGAKHSLNKSEMENTITEAGYTPKQRNQLYEIIS